MRRRRAAAGLVLLCGVSACTGADETPRARVTVTHTVTPGTSSAGEQPPPSAPLPEPRGNTEAGREFLDQVDLPGYGGEWSVGEPRFRLFGRRDVPPRAGYTGNISVFVPFINQSREVSPAPDGRLFVLAYRREVLPFLAGPAISCRPIVGHEGWCAFADGRGYKGSCIHSLMLYASTYVDRVGPARPIRDGRRGSEYAEVPPTGRIYLRLVGPWFGGRAEDVAAMFVDGTFHESDDQTRPRCETIEPDWFEVAGRY